MIFFIKLSFFIFCLIFHFSYLLNNTILCNISLSFTNSNSERVKEVINFNLSLANFKLSIFDIHVQTAVLGTFPQYGRPFSVGFPADLQFNCQYCSAPHLPDSSKKTNVANSATLSTCLCSLSLNSL